MPNEADDYVDQVMAELDSVSGDDDAENRYIGELVEVGAIDQVGAELAARMPPSQRAAKIRDLVMRKLRGGNRRQGPRPAIPPGAMGNPSPPFGRSARETERRAPLGFTEDTTGANFFTLAAVVGATTTMRAKVSRAAHADRLLIVPSAPGVVLESVKVGDEEQVLASGAGVELYSTAALTDSEPDNFSPLGPALDFVVVLKNTTAVAITGTIGIKARVKR